jgi:signal transduction histidine kinase
MFAGKEKGAAVMSLSNRLMSLSIQTKIALTFFFVMILFSLSVLYIFEQSLPILSSHLSATTIIRIVSAILVAAVLAFALGYFLSRRILYRLDNLSENVKKIEQGCWEELQYIKTAERDEITRLIESMEYMSKKVRTRIHEEKHLKDFYHTILESLDEMVIVLDREWNIDYHNNHTLQETLLENPEIWRRILEELRHGRKESIIELIEKSGKQRTLRVLGREHQGKRIIHLSDITSVRLLEEQQCFINNFEIIGEISTVVVHEIKNHLQPIRLLIEQEEIDRKDQQKIIEVLDKMDRMVMDFLKSGKPIDKAMATDLDIAEALREVTGMLEKTLKEKGVGLATELEGDLRIHMARNDFDILLTNLIYNALEASETGTTIRLMALNEEEYGVLRIINKGEMISKETLKNMSKPFFSTKEEGTGIGMYIIFKTVYLYGGFVEVHSDGKETVISLYLPRKEAYEYSRH